MLRARRRFAPPFSLSLRFSYGTEEITNEAPMMRIRGGSRRAAKWWTGSAHLWPPGNKETTQASSQARNSVHAQPPGKKTVLTGGSRSAVGAESGDRKTNTWAQIVIHSTHATCSAGWAGENFGNGPKAEERNGPFAVLSFLSIFFCFKFQIQGFNSNSSLYGTFIHLKCSV